MAITSWRLVPATARVIVHLRFHLMGQTASARTPLLAMTRSGARTMSANVADCRSGSRTRVTAAQTSAPRKRGPSPAGLSQGRRHALPPGTALRPARRKQGLSPVTMELATGWGGKPAGGKIPYRLPELAKAPGREVFICEGEKRADAVAKLGYLATTASEGAGKWTPELNEWFKDRDVYVLPDNDEPGRHHAEQVASNLKDASPVRSVSCTWRDWRSTRTLPIG